MITKITQAGENGELRARCETLQADLVFLFWNRFEFEVFPSSFLLYGWTFFCHYSFIITLKADLEEAKKQLEDAKQRLKDEREIQESKMAELEEQVVDKMIIVLLLLLVVVLMY